MSWKHYCKISFLQYNEQEIESEDENGLEKDFECTAIESEIKAGTNKPQLSWKPFDGNVTWVRIPLPAPKNPHS